MSQIRTNLISNTVGQIVVTLCNLAFIPIYINNLGSSGYAFYGLYVVFLSWLILLDGGLTPTIVRELGKYSNIKKIPINVRNIFKSIELIFILVVVIIISSFYIWGDLIAETWLNVGKDYKDSAPFILLLVAILACIGLFESLYRGALLGLQNHLQLNIIISIGAILKSVGSVIVITTLDYGLMHFLLWHISISFLYVLIMKLVIYKKFVFSDGSARFSYYSLKSISSFAGSMFIILLLGTVLTQADKIILGKMLSLSDLGYYLFAYSCAGIILKLASPVSSSFYPKFCELYNQNKTEELIEGMHDSTQLIFLITIGLSSVLMLSSYSLILVWSGSSELASSVSLILSILTIGTFINVMAWIPYYIQLSYGITDIAVRSNIIAILVMVPLLIILSDKYGAIGAALSWPITNLIYLIFSVNLGLKRIFPFERKKWFVKNFFVPIIPLFIIVIIHTLFIESPVSISQSIVEIILIFIITTFSALLLLKRTWKYIPFLIDLKA